MKPNTLIRTADGRVGRIVYHSLDGYGIKWGLRRWPEDDPPEPDAMLRNLYPSASVECVGEVYEVIPTDEQSIRLAVDGRAVPGAVRYRGLDPMPRDEAEDEDEPAPEPAPLPQPRHRRAARVISWAIVWIVTTVLAVAAGSAGTYVAVMASGEAVTPQQRALSDLERQPIWGELGPPERMCAYWGRDGYATPTRMACAAVAPQRPRGGDYTR